ncbi:MAG: sialidase family protein [Gammaproteobacteria bacterium]
MKIARLIPSFVLLAGGLHSITAWSESDAMQITTHFNNLTGIACDSSGQSCISVGVAHHPNTLDHVVYTTSNGGITWSQGTLLSHPDQHEDSMADPTDSSQNFMTIRCNTTGQDCIIAGTTSIGNHSNVFTYTSHDGGQSWSKPQLLSISPLSEDQNLVDEYPFIRLKCNTSANSCILATNTTAKNQQIPTLFTTQNGGESWSAASPLTVPPSAPNGITILDLACDHTGLFCTALTSTAEYNNSLQAPPATPLTPTAFIYSTHDSGITWSDPKPLMLTRQNNEELIQSTNDILNILSCDPSGLSCIGLGTLYTTETSETPEITTTTVTGNNTHAYLTKNGGLTWQDTTEIVASDPKLLNTFTALHCDISNRFCATVGFATNEDAETDEFIPIIYTTIDSGHTWQKKPFTPSPDILSLMLDVFCSEDAALCHAVGFFLKS